jgi:hypothetical protein
MVPERHRGRSLHRPRTGPEGSRESWEYSTRLGCLTPRGGQEREKGGKGAPGTLNVERSTLNVQRGKERAYGEDRLELKMSCLTRSISSGLQWLQRPTHSSSRAAVPFRGRGARLRLLRGLGSYLYSSLYRLIIAWLLPVLYHRIEQVNMKPARPRRRRAWPGWWVRGWVAPHHGACLCRAKWLP